MTLRLAPGFSLPLDAVTQSIAIIAKRRAGKSYTARRLTEEHRAGQQLAIVDPKGDWWGVRSAADGRGPGLPIVILGGERGDVPLEAGAGDVVAKLVVEDRVSALLDLSLFRKHELATFMTGFLEALYRLKAREAYRTPMMLVIDEADAIAPQRPGPGEERMLGAAEDIVRRGGQRGIGCTLITQRTAVLNNWIDVHGTPEERAKLMEVLPALPTGDAWFWSPGWPTAEGIFQRIHILPIATFDSGATPKPGEKRTEPRSVADVDLEALRRQMAATIERAKADDPRELRRQIAELKRQLAAAAARRPVPAAKRVEVPVVSETKLQAVADRIARLEQLVVGLRETVQGWRELHAAHVATFARASGQPAPPPPGRLERVQPPRPVARPTPSSGNGREHTLGNTGARRMLVALAQHPAGLTASKLSILTWIARSGGTWRTYLAQIRGAGWVTGHGGRLEITAAGLAAVGEYEPLPIGSALIDYWRRRLGDTGKRRIFDILVEAYPRALPIGDVAARAGMGIEGGTWRTYIAALRSLELVEGRGELLASEALFA